MILKSLLKSVIFKDVSNDSLLESVISKDISNTFSYTVNELSDALSDAGKEFQEAQDVLEDFKDTTIRTTKASNDVAGGIGAVSSSFKSLNLFGIGAAAAIAAVVVILYKLSKVSDEVTKKAQKLSEEFSSTKDEITDYKEQVEDLQKTISDSSSSIEEVTEARKSLMLIQNELIDKYGDEAGTIDLIKEALYGETDAINSTVDAWDKLIQKQWKATKAEINESGIWDNLYNKLYGYNDNLDQIISEYNNQSFSLGIDLFNNTDATDQYISDKENELISLLKSVGVEISYWGNDVTSAYFNGTADEVYEKLLKLQELISEDSEFYTDKFGKQLSDSLKEVKKVIDDNEDVVKQFTLYEEILSDSGKELGYADYYKNLVNAYSEYQDARISGDKEAVESAGKAYAEIFTNAYDNAVKNGDTDVAKYLEDMYPELQDIIGEWKFKLDFEAGEGLKNAINDTLDKIDGIIDGASNYTIEDILNFNYETATEEQKEAYDILTKAAEGYGLTLEQLLELLQQLGLIESMSYRQLVDAFGSENAKTLSSEQLEIAYILSPADYDSFDEFVKEINRQLQAKITVDFDYETESEELDNLQTALEEVVSGAGLSEESISNITKRYEELEDFNAEELFERTANGIHLNTKALNKYEKALKDKKISNFAEKLNNLKNQYDYLTDKIENCTDASKRAEYESQRDSIEDQIKNVNTLASEYLGLYSAYNKWQEEKSNGDDRDMYESIATEREDIIEELSRGWLDSDAKAYIDMLSDKDLSTATFEEYIAEFKRLHKEIGNTGYNFFDFFTLDEDGNSTSEGIFNFFDAVQKELGETYAWIDKETGKRHFNFSDGLIEEAFGISTKAIQIIEKAAQSAGFDVDLGINLDVEGGEDLDPLLDTENGETDIDLNTNFNIPDTLNNYVEEFEKRGIFLPVRFLFDGNELDTSKTKNSLPSLPEISSTNSITGEAKAEGNAFAGGTHESLDKALGGELGPELRVRDGEYDIIGADGAEFFDYKKDDIIFNAEQTEELLKNGKLTHGNTRGKAFAKGIAPKNIKEALILDNGGSKVTGTVETSVNLEVSDNSSGEGPGTQNEITSLSDLLQGLVNKISSGSGSGSDDFEEDFDWIEVAISRVERLITNLGKTVSATYKTWSKRNSALDEELQMVSSEINLQQQAYDKYMSLANSVGLSDNYKQLVQSGAIDYETITDEDLADKIKEYQDFYEKALDCEDAIIDLQDEIANLAKTKFDNVVSEYDSKLSLIEHEISLLDSYINQVETRGYFVSKLYYEELINTEKDNIAMLEEEYNSLQNALAEAMRTGNIEKYSEDWYDMQSSINDVELAIIDANTALIEYRNTMREIQWDIFDRMEDMLSEIQEESNFLIDLMSNDKLITETGSFTDQGDATLGLHVVNYGAYMSQAEDYAKELEAINKELANDPNNLDLIDRRKELLETQRDMILAAEDEKQAIYDLVEEAYQTLLEYIGDVIDKRKELLQTTKD